jgi:hypothetical protein
MRTYFSYSSTLVLLTLSMNTVAADAPRSVADCQNISDRIERFACYDKAEAKPKTSAPAAASPASVAPSGATQSTISARRATPTENTAVTNNSAATTNSAAKNSAAEKTTTNSTGSAAVTTAPEKESVLKKFLPFGLGKDKNAESTNVAQPAAEATPPAEDTVEGFGLSSSAARVENNDEGKLELTDTIANLKTSEQLLWEVTLSSGQVWRQMYTQRYAMSVGDKVRITSTRWGKAYRLYDEKTGGFMQVARVK